MSRSNNDPLIKYSKYDGYLIRLNNKTYKFDSDLTINDPNFRINFEFNGPLTLRDFAIKAWIKFVKRKGDRLNTSKWKRLSHYNLNTKNKRIVKLLEIPHEHWAHPKNAYLRQEVLK